MKHIELFCHLLRNQRWFCQFDNFFWRLLITNLYDFLGQEFSFKASRALEACPSINKNL